MDETEACEKDIKNEEIFWYYFKYQSSLFLVKYLLEAKQTKNVLILNEVNDAKNGFSRKGTPNEIINFGEKIFDFNKEQKCKD